MPISVQNAAFPKVFVSRYVHVLSPIEKATTSLSKLTRDSNIIALFQNTAIVRSFQTNEMYKIQSIILPL